MYTDVYTSVYTSNLNLPQVYPQPNHITKDTGLSLDPHVTCSVARIFQQNVLR